MIGGGWLRLLDVCMPCSYVTILVAVHCRSAAALVRLTNLTSALSSSSPVRGNTHGDELQLGQACLCGGKSASAAVTVVSGYADMQRDRRLSPKAEGEKQKEQT